METKQLNGYKIEFYSEEEWKEEVPTYRTKGIQIICESDEDTFEYAGLINEINEELAEKIVGKNTINGVVMYFHYKDSVEDFMFTCKTAKQSFQTLSDLEYCVITKTS